MPVYEFQHEDGEILSLHLDLKQPPEAYRRQEVNGRLYKRIYTVPLAAKDTKKGDLTKEDFKRMTTDKNLTVGKMMDISKELSEERASKHGGIDPVQEKHYAEFEKSTGKVPLAKQKRDRLAAAQKKLDKFGVKVTL